MVTINKIAETCPTNVSKKDGYDVNQIAISGEFGGVCYAKEGYKTVSSQPIEKALNRANNCAVSGHHSVFGHSMINMEIECPKIIAMLLNSIGVSNTSEKSARYTTMKPHTILEQQMYNKWHDKFVDLINNTYPDKFTEKEVDKLAYENARYMISVFTPTSMVYSVPFRNLFYIKQWADNMVNNIDTNIKINICYNNWLRNEVKLLSNEIQKIIDSCCNEDLSIDLKDNKNEYFRFMPYQAINSTGERKEYYGDVYSSSYLASFAEIAQAQRHRTTRLSIMFDGSCSNGFYIPAIIRTTQLAEEWLRDIHEVAAADVIPQGALCEVTETGNFEDFVLKCKERMCGRAQLEIQEVTTYQIINFINCKENLCEENLSRLNNLIDPETNIPCMRCKYKDFKCSEGCKWGPAAINRKI